MSDHQRALNEQARATQTVEFAVAPGCTVPTMTRGVRTAGQEVTRHDVDAGGSGAEPIEVLQRLVGQGHVLRRAGEDGPIPRARAGARYVTTTDISTQRGLVRGGYELVPADVGGDGGVADLVRRGLVVDNG
jgi:hypothetical protein